MSNIHNERLMEDLFYKHLEVQEKYLVKVIQWQRY